MDNQVSDYWSSESPSDPGIQWIEVPKVERNINFRATGHSDKNWIVHSSQFLSHLPTPKKALSLGCGFGDIERFLVKENICQFVDGIDIAEGAIEKAKELAERENLSQINYQVKDLNTCTFPENTYDVVYAHASLHHVYNLEHLYEQIQNTLRPNGVFISYEYIGPTQMQFPEAHLSLANRLLQLLPDTYRQNLRVGGIKDRVSRLDINLMNKIDPSEAVRSSEVLPLMASRFEFDYLRFIGGTLAMLVLNDIAGNFKDNDTVTEPFLDLLIHLDNTLIDSGILPSYHAYAVCRLSEQPPLVQNSQLPITQGILGNLKLKQDQDTRLESSEISQMLDSELEQFLSTLAKEAFKRNVHNEYFEKWQRAGIHLTPNHLYSPIPDTSLLPESLWENPSSLSGIDMNDSHQLDFLKNIFPQFQDELDRIPYQESEDETQFYLDNNHFSGTDALVLYAMIRHFKPKRIVEIGSGFTTLLALQALQQNNVDNPLFIAIDSRPSDMLRNDIEGLDHLIIKNIQDVDVELFSILDDGDILLIETSHVVHANSDVNRIILDILPTLNSSVIIHIHGIFLPFEYPKQWIMENHRFWNEQYLFQAFLSGNKDFQVLFGNTYMQYKYPQQMRDTFPKSNWWGGGSFWLQKLSEVSKPAPIKIFVDLLEPNQDDPSDVQHKLNEAIVASWDKKRTMRGYCNLSGQEVEFEWHSENLREDIVASSSRSINRQRQLVCNISMALFNHPYATLEAIAGHINKHKLNVYSAEANGTFHRYLQQYVDPDLLTTSDYLGDNYQSGTIVNQVRHEDLQKTSFDDEMFDLIISAEVFEHIPDALMAEKEVVRILKPGGYYCFSVPFHTDHEEDNVLAAINEQGEIEYYTEPQYHGDPLNPEEGILVFRIFSYFAMKKRFEANRCVFKSYSFWSQQLGIFGSGRVTHVVYKLP